MDDVIRNDGPDDRCFGCGHSNPAGLRLAFRVTAPGTVESEVEVDERFAGSPGVVHGGIQATLLDEVLGMAAHRGAGEEGARIVTAEFHLRYRRPVRTGAKLVLRGRLVRVLGRDYRVEGEILDGDGHTLTEADARWRRVD